MAANGAVGASEVARFPGLVEGTEGGRDVLRQLRAGGGVDGIGAREAFEIPEPVEGLDDLFWVGQDGDGVRLLSGAWGLAGFELAIEDQSGVGEFVFWQAEGGAKEDLGRPAFGGANW